MNKKLRRQYARLTKMSRIIQVRAHKSSFLLNKQDNTFTAYIRLKWCAFLNDFYLRNYFHEKRKYDSMTFKYSLESTRGN